MCTQRSPYNWSAQLYQRHGETISKYLETSVFPSLVERRNEDLLKELVRRWSNHKIMNKWMRQFFQYLDRYHVKYHSLPTLLESGLHKFRDLIFDKIKGEVATAILHLINQEREGAMIDRSLIRNCIELFESMGMGNLQLYVQDFEALLLDSTTSFYKEKASKWIEIDPTPAYLVKVENAL